MAASPGARDQAGWNEDAFSCDACGHWYPIATTRIRRIDGETLCRRCAARTQPRDAASIDVHTLCATCAQPLAGNHRIILNSVGLFVHYRCPTKTRTQRAASELAYLTEHAS